MTFNNAGQSASSPANDKGSGFSTGQQAVPIVDVNNPTGIKEIAAQTKQTNTKLTCTNAVEKAASQAILKQLTLDTVNWINHGFQGGSSFFPKDTGSFLKEIGDSTVNQFVTNIGFDNKNYPFGRMVAQHITQQLQSSFEQRARYSLDQVLAQQTPGITPIDFQNDFVNGGWAAFDAQFNIGNNPIGFQLDAESTLSSRVADTAYSPAQDIKDQLMRAGGLLDTKICVSPATYDSGGPGTSDPIAAQARIDLKNASAAQQNNGSSDLLTSLINQQKQKIAANTCARWETQTPGSAVSSALNEALSTPFKNLELGTDLSTDLTAVFDALSNQLVQKGLASLSSNNSKSGGNQTTYTNNGSYVPNVSVDGTGGIGTNFLSAGDAYQTNIFDLDPSGKEELFTKTIDANGNTIVNGVGSVPNPGSPNGATPPVRRINLVGLINREQQMVSTSQQTADALASAFSWTPAQEKVWADSMAARDPNYTNLLGKQVNLAQRLIPVIYELDFCVPGPHPGWQADAQNHLESFLKDPETFPQSADASDLAKFGKKYGGTIGTVVGLAAGVAAGAAIGAAGGSVVPGLGTAIGAVVGVIVGVIIYEVSNNADHRNEAVYRPIVEHYLNISIDDKVHREHVNGYDPSANIFLTFGSEYLDAMNKAYTDPALIQAGISPDLLAADKTEMAAIPTYQQAIKANSLTVSEIQNTISQLVFLGKRIHDLENNTHNLAGFPDPAPKTYQDFQDQLTAINGVTNTSKLTPYQLELRRINDTFNLISPDLLADSDIAAQEAALDSVSNKLENLAGTDSGSLLNECVSEVNQIAADDPNTSNADGAPLAPLGRIPFPLSLDGNPLPGDYLSPDFMARIKYSISFLPDYYYGSATTGDSVQLNDNPASKVPRPPGNYFLSNRGGYTPGDPAKAIGCCDNVVQMNSEKYPYSLAGLEYVMGIY